MSDNTYLNEKNTVFFSTASDNYVFRAASSLLSIRKHLPNSNLYIISKQLSNKSKKFLYHNNISFIEIDLTYLFFQSFEYPIECFYLFAGPSLFKKLGFKYSVYIDGDILCLDNPLKHNLTINDLGGVEANTFSELFGTEQLALTSLFKLDTKSFDKKRLQSGIIFMNNERLSELEFLEKSGQLYYECWKNGCPRRGDDSLFALYQMAMSDKLSIKRLSPDYNFMPIFHGYKIAKTTLLFHFLLDKPWKTKPYYHLDKQQDSFNNLIKAWRRISKKAGFIQWSKDLYFINIITRIHKKLLKLYRQIPFVLNGTRASIIKKRRNLKKAPIRLYWWEPSNINNFGDLVSKDILLMLFGRAVTKASEEECDLIAAGSILEIIQKVKHKSKFYVWGSGFIDKASTNKGLEKAVYKAVRGLKSREKINKRIAVGDPGILANATYAIKRKKHSKKIGVVIHYADMQTPLAKRFCEDNRFTVISPLDSPENVIKNISQCGLILSSSLHGLIFADSLSIPNYHIKMSDNLTGGEYKFIDYYSGVNKKYKQADLSKVFNSEYLKTLVNSYRPISNLIKKQKDLIESFPFK